MPTVIRAQASADRSDILEGYSLSSDFFKKPCHAGKSGKAE